MSRLETDVWVMEFSKASEVVITRSCCGKARVFSTPNSWYSCLRRREWVRIYHCPVGDQLASSVLVGIFKATGKVVPLWDK